MPCNHCSCNKCEYDNIWFMGTFLKFKIYKVLIRKLSWNFYTGSVIKQKKKSSAEILGSAVRDHVWIYETFIKTYLIIANCKKGFLRMLLSRLDARWLPTATAKPNCKGITVLGPQAANMACIRDNCFIEIFTSSTIEWTVFFVFDKVCCRVNVRHMFMILIPILISFAAFLIHWISSSWLDSRAWYQALIKKLLILLNQKILLFVVGQPGRLTFLLSSLTIKKLLTAVLLSTACFKQVPLETAIPVFYLVLGWHQYVAISLNFLTFLKDNGRLRIWEISIVKFSLIL